MRLTESICKNLYEETEEVEEVESSNESSEDIEEKFKKFLKDEVDKLTSNGMLEAYWDYRDEEAFRENVLDEIKENGATETILDDLTEKFEEDAYNDWTLEYESEFVNGIINDMPEDIKEYYENNVDDIWSYLDAAGYQGVDTGIREHLEDVEVPLELLIVTPAEANYDMGSIITSYGSYDYPDIESFADGSLDLDYFDNGLTYLLHQQGHTAKELLERRLLGKKTDSTLIESVATELVNDNAEIMTGLYALASIPLYEIPNFLKSGAIITENAILGLVNTWNGSGSVLEIKLEKPLQVPAEYLDVRGAFGASVSEIYGLSYSDYPKGAIKSTDSVSPDLVQEDIAATVKEVAKEWEKEQND